MDLVERVAREITGEPQKVNGKDDPFHEMDVMNNYELAKAIIPLVEAEVKRDCLQAVADEPEFPDDMPNELSIAMSQLEWDKLTVTNLMRLSVRLTKEGIAERIEALKVGS